jgi:hypothetical protein
MPVDLERRNAMNLNDRCFRGITEHPAALWSESISPGFQLVERRRIEAFAKAKIPGSLHDRNMFVDRVRVRLNDRSGQFSNPHHKRLARNLWIALEEFDVSRHFSQRDDSGLIEPLSIVGTSYS